MLFCSIASSSSIVRLMASLPTKAPIATHNLSRDWRRVCAAKKLPRVDFHALRHTHASLLIAKGVDVLAVGRRLGHSRASTMLDKYRHLVEGADAAAAKAIEGLLK